MSDSAWVTSVGSVLARIWSSATTAAPAPDRRIILACAAIAVVFIVITPLWRLARNVISLAHEGAHAVAAFLTGRQLRGIRLHSDTSGVTLSKGRPTGFGMCLTAFAGYVGPSIIGLGAAWLLAHGFAMGLLWVLVALLALLVLQIRNGYGLLLVLVCAGALTVPAWFGAPDLASATACTLTWFLLVGAIRPVIELQIQRSHGQARGSDADQLARLTGVPGLVWVGVFVVVAVGAAALGASWLVRLF